MHINRGQTNSPWSSDKNPLGGSGGQAEVGVSVQILTKHDLLGSEEELRSVMMDGDFEEL